MVKIILAAAIALFALAVHDSKAQVLNDTANTLNPLVGDVVQKNFEPYAETFKKKCPICDTSVYSYCSDKLFHDSCCCHNPNNPYDKLPYHCQLADCSFLHANTCYEHKLITACCCVS